MNDLTCKKCGDFVEVDGEYPKYFAWCEECNDYATGFDAHEYAIDIRASQIDEARDRAKYGEG